VLLGEARRAAIEAEIVGDIAVDPAAVAGVAEAHVVARISDAGIGNALAIVADLSDIMAPGTILPDIGDPHPVLMPLTIDHLHALVGAIVALGLGTADLGLSVALRNTRLMLARGLPFGLPLRIAVRLCRVAAAASLGRMATASLRLGAVAAAMLRFRGMIAMTTARLGGRRGRNRQRCNAGC
jgi:hypothetical protein